MNFVDENNYDRQVGFTLVLPLDSVWDLHHQAEIRAKAGKRPISRRQNLLTAHRHSVAGRRKRDGTIQMLGGFLGSSDD
jgi:hypothetical protein